MLGFYTYAHSCFTSQIKALRDFMLQISIRRRFHSTRARGSLWNFMFRISAPQIRALNPALKFCAPKRHAVKFQILKFRALKFRALKFQHPEILRLKISRLKRQNEIFVPNRAIRAPVLPAQRNLMRVRRILTLARIAHALRRSYKFKFQIPPI